MLRSYSRTHMLATILATAGDVRLLEPACARAAQWQDGRPAAGMTVRPELRCVFHNIAPYRYLSFCHQRCKLLIPRSLLTLRRSENRKKEVYFTRTSESKSKLYNEPIVLRTRFYIMSVPVKVISKPLYLTHSHLTLNSTPDSPRGLDSLARPTNSPCDA